MSAHVSEDCRRGEAMRAMHSWLGRMPWAFVWLLLTATLFGAAPPGDELRDWVRQLDADDEAIREEAGRALLAAGVSAVGPLFERLRSGSPSAVLHAASVLEQIAAEGSEATGKHVASELDHLRQHGRPGLTVIAEALKTKLRRLRVERAVQKVRLLGGKFEGDHKGAANPMLSAIAANEKVPIASSAPIQPLQPDPPPGLPAEEIVSIEKSPIRATPGVIADAFVSPLVAASGDTLDVEMALTMDQSWRGGDAELDLLRELPCLTNLILRGAPITDGALEHLVRLPRLQTLSIDCGQFSAAALARFQDRQPRTLVIVRGRDQPVQADNH